MHPLVPHQKHHDILKNRKFVLNVVLDGIAIAQSKHGDAFSVAHKPCIDRLLKAPLYRTLYAHGKYVGMPSNTDMGNSEVGHNALGSGKVYSQGAKLVNESIAKGNIFKSAVWQKAMAIAKQDGRTLHFISLLSDGNVHSHISHLEAISQQAADNGCKEICLHALLDGRDTPPRSSLGYIDRIEKHFSQLNNKYACNARIASVAGRMVCVMDRYEAQWEMVERGWQLMVEGKGEMFSSALDGVLHRQNEKNEDDQYATPFLVADSHHKKGVMKDGDAVLLLNFRGDRAIEISKAFEAEVPIKKEKQVSVFFAGMMLYDGDASIPSKYLVEPPEIKNTMGQYLVKSGVSLFALSETQKFGHVTYFWNGNRSQLFDATREHYVEIKSDTVPFDQRPWMKSAEITDSAIALLQSGKYRYGRINYPNGDMVGHTGDFHAARMAVEAVDIGLSRLLAEVEKLGGLAIVTADHGNCDEMFQLDKQGDPKKTADGQMQLKTSHTLNKVPFCIFDPTYNHEYTLNKDLLDAGIANIAATTLELLGFIPPKDYEPSLLSWNV